MAISRISALCHVAVVVVFGGAVGCASSGPATVRLSGTVGYVEDMALPAGALVTIALHEQRTAEHDDVEIARRVIETSEEPPVPFSVSLPGGGIDPDAMYTVDAWISAGSRNRISGSSKARTSLMALTSLSPGTRTATLRSPVLYSRVLMIPSGETLRNSATCSMVVVPGVSSVS